MSDTRKVATANDSSSVTATFEAFVDEDGKVVWDEPVLVTAKFFRIFRNKRVTITVEREKKLRSDAQNRFYWGMVIPVVSEATGYESEEAHDVLKTLFLKAEKVLPSGELVEVVRSTTKLTPAEFSEFVNKCARWCGEQGWYVPQPGDDRERVTGRRVE